MKTVILLWLTVTSLLVPTSINWVYTPANTSHIYTRIPAGFTTNQEGDMIAYAATIDSLYSIDISYYDFKRTDYQMHQDYQTENPLTAYVKLTQSLLAATLESINTITLSGGTASGGTITGKEVAMSYVNQDTNVPEMLFFRVYYWGGKLYVVSVRGQISRLNTLTEHKNTVFNSLYYRE